MYNVSWALDAYIGTNHNFIIKMRVMEDGDEVT